MNLFNVRKFYGKLAGYINNKLTTLVLINTK